MENGDIMIHRKHMAQEANQKEWEEFGKGKKSTGKQSYYTEP